MVKPMFRATIYEDKLSILFKKIEAATTQFASAGTVEELNQIVNGLSSIIHELQDLTNRYTPENNNFIGN